MGSVFYSDPADGCRLHSLQLVGFTEAQPPNYSGCRFSLSPDGTRAAPGGSVWSPLGGVVAIPRVDGFGLETAAGHTIVVRGRTPAFKPDGTLTQVRDGELVEWSIDCRPGDRLFTLPGDNATARCVRTVYPHPVEAVAWFSNSRFAAVLPSRELVIANLLVRAGLPRFRSASLDLSPKRSLATLWLDGELAGTFDAGGGPAPIAPVGTVTALAWAPSERWLVAATREGAVFLLRPDTGDARVRRLGISARDLAWR
jgi:WD40 repeat protein